MAKTQIDPQGLPEEVADTLDTLSNAVRRARLRRRWSQTLLAEKAGVTTKTVQAVETGRAGTSLAHVLSVLWALRLTDALRSLADPSADHIGRALEARHARRRARASGAPSDLDTDF